jgi:hypothetical protein
MKARTFALAAFCALLYGCVTPPGEEQPDGREPATPGSSTGSPAADPAAPAASPLAVLEEHHRALAQTYVRERNWADAVVQWELLLLLKPDSAEYRNAAEESRAQIRNAAASLLPAADHARRLGNLDQATLLYLRVLNIDRENAAAAQALRDIDAERTKRAYINRPPRGSI